RAAHHHEPVEALAQVAHAAVDLAQLLLAVDVFGILRAVTLGRGFGHGAGHLRAMDAPEVVELLLQATRALCSGVLGSGRFGPAVARHAFGDSWGSGPCSVRRVTDSGGAPR